METAKQTVPSAEALTEAEIRFISDFIYQRSGIVLGEAKRYLIETRLRSVARVADIPSLHNLCRQLSTHNQQLETLVIDALTTNETSWFRDKKPFDALQNEILPAIHQKKGNNKVLQIWSAACSTGQEPYGMAITLLESGLFRDWLIRIVATDISQRVLEQAREGRYSQLEVTRGMPIRTLIKYFSQVGEIWKIKQEVQKMVTFKEHRLQDDPTSLGTFDLVFCRNVLIYFDVETKGLIFNRLHNAMTTDGLLALGGSETTLNVTDKFETVKIEQATFYIKKNTRNFWCERKDNNVTIVRK
jgi:chemotaxis protein methyltransferase CheR